MKQQPLFNAAGVVLCAMTLVSWGRVAHAQTFSAAASVSPEALQSAGSNWLIQAGSGGVRIHAPSTIVKCKDEYWFFYPGRGIRSYRSKDLISWMPGPAVFTNQL